MKAQQVIIRTAEEFYNFCVDKLNKNLSGTFVQKFFYIDSIDRNQPIEVVTTKSSSTWHSVRSCGFPYVVESREIGCVCESCILSDGSACPNQAYCPPWRAVNLRTGKPLLDDNFKNLHWPIPLTEIAVATTEVRSTMTETTVFVTMLTILLLFKMKHQIGTQLWILLGTLPGILTLKIMSTHYPKMSCST